MKRLALLMTLLALSGCTVTLHGHQSSGEGRHETRTGSSLQAGKQVGNAKVGASFGQQSAAQAGGGQIRFSQGASAVVVLALVIAGTAEMISDWLKPAAPQNERLPEGSISQTCSCYGWQPEVAPPQAAQ